MLGLQPVSEEPLQVVQPLVETNNLDQEDMESINSQDQLLIVEALREALESASLGKRELLKFDGSGNVDFWLLTFRKRTEGVSENKKLQLFMHAMAGPAYNWFCGQMLGDESLGITTSADEWMCRLKTFFGKTTASALDELEARVQKEGEEPLCYIRDVLRLCIEVDPTMEDQAKVRHLQRGLLPRYSKDMILMDPKDPTQFQEKLLKLVAASRTHGMDLPMNQHLIQTLVAALVDKKAPSVAFKEPLPRKKDLFCFYPDDEKEDEHKPDILAVLQQGFANLNRGVTDLKKLVSKDTQSKPPLRGGSSGDEPPRTDFRNQRRPPRQQSWRQHQPPRHPGHGACFNCGQFDHFAKNCPHPKSPFVSSGNGQA